MPVDVQLTATGDLPDVGQEITGLDLIVQRVQVALGIHRGEYFRDPSIGVPWADIVTQKPPRFGENGATLRATVLGVDGVAACTSWTYDYQPSAFRVDYTGRFVLEDQAVIEVTLSATPDRDGLTMSWRPIAMTAVL